MTGEAPAADGLVKSRDGLGRVGFRLANLGHYCREEIITPRCPSRKARTHGWGYFVLPSGSYAFLSLREWTNCFDVPPNQPVTYIGSTHVNFSSPKEIRLRNESELAQASLRSWFGHTGAVSTTLMRPLNAAVRWVPREELMPLRIALQPGEFVTPDWKARAMALALGGPGPNSAAGLIPGPAGAGASVAGLLELLYLPIGIQRGKERGEKDQQKWGPSMEELRDYLRQHSEEKLVAALLGSLTQFGITNASVAQTNSVAVLARDPEANSLLRADILQAQLREGEKRLTFFVEVAVRIRLWDKSATPLYDGCHIYSRPEELQPEERAARPYRLQLGEKSTIRKLEHYCNPKGQEAVLAEMCKAIQLSMTEVLRQVTGKAKHTAH